MALSPLVLNAAESLISKDADPATLRAHAETARHPLGEEIARELVRRKLAEMRVSRGPLSQAEYAMGHGYIAGVEDCMSILDAITEKADLIEQMRAKAAEAVQAGGR